MIDLIFMETAMELVIEFSCDETIIDLKPFKEKGYDATVTYVNYKGNNKDIKANITVTKGPWPEDSKFCYVLCPEANICDNNILTISAQKRAYYRSYLHPSMDECVWPLIKNMSINFIYIMDDDCTEFTDTYADEESLVVSMLLGHQWLCEEPFTPKWRDFYSKHKELANDYMEKHTKQAKDFMLALIEGDVKFKKVG